MRVSFPLGNNGGTKYGIGNERKEKGHAHICAVARVSKQTDSDFLWPR